MKKRLLSMLLVFTVSVTPVSYISAEQNSESMEASQLDIIINNIKQEEQDAVERLRKELDTVYTTAGDTYQEVKANINVIEGWYETEKKESSNLYGLVNQAFAMYCREMAASFEIDSDEWSDACDAFDEEVCDGLFDDYQENVDDGFYDEINTKYYDEILGNAEDEEDYSSWLDVESDFYSNWLDAASDFYSDWLDAETDLYSAILDLSLVKYDDTFNVDAFLKEHILDEEGSFTVDPDVEEITYSTQEEESEQDAVEEDIAEDAPENAAAPIDFDSSTEWYQTNPMLICEGVYFVGKDIVPGNYGIKCVSSDYGMSVIVFESEDSYYAYHHSSRFTYGEEDDAIEANASRYDYIYEDNEIALNLHEGNVLRIKEGIGELLSSDPDAVVETETEVGNAFRLFDGVYVVGKDIDAGGYVITSTGEYGTSFVVFESEEKLADFDAADHFTNGEFGADVEQNAMIDIYVDENKPCYINLQDGMVLMLDNGSGTAQQVKMAWSE